MKVLTDKPLQTSFNAKIRRRTVESKRVSGQRGVGYRDSNLTGVCQEPSPQPGRAHSSAPAHLGGAPTPAPSGRPSITAGRAGPAQLQLDPRLLPHTHFMPRLKSFIRGHSSENVKENVNPEINGQEPFVCDKIWAVTCALLALRVRRETLIHRTTSETPPSLLSPLPEQALFLPV